ncbi:hypothetical protein R1flu_011592 [Riccia fluitans]|uniref:RING-type E3 ubiquitin transferase n=1 Tax=Riccia fluitans TaxID=41844 RepID=A0ABD1Z8G6_9MARC
MSTPIGIFDGNSPVSADSTFAVNSKIMTVAVVVLFGVVMFILGLHMYAKWFWRHGGHNGRNSVGWRRRRTRLEFATDWPGNQSTTPAQVGLERTLLDEVPTFTYRREERDSDEVLDCAVCLEEFEEGEKGRLLPKCNHSFHIECIDMWFHSHSTCPLCRCSVAPENPQPPQVITGGVPVVLPPHFGNIIVNITAISGVDSGEDQETSAAGAVNERRSESLAPVDSAAAGTGVGEPSPRQQMQGSRPASPSSRRPSIGFPPKPPPSTPSGIPTNVLFWGNHTQMSSVGAVSEESSGPERLYARANAPSMLVIEISRGDGSLIPGQHQSSNTGVGDESNRVSDAQGESRLRSPISRLSSSFRRLLSIRRTPTSPGPEDACNSLELDQQQRRRQQQEEAGSTISSSAGTSFEV